MNSDISMILQILQSNNANRGFHGDGAATPMSDHPPPNYSHINSPSDSEEKFSQNISLHREDRVVSQVYIHVERYQRYHYPRIKWFPKTIFGNLAIIMHF